MTKRERKQLIKEVSGNWPIVLRAKNESGYDDGGKAFHLTSHQDERLFVDFANSKRDWFIETGQADHLGTNKTTK